MKFKLLLIAIFVCGFTITVQSQDYLDMIEAETFSVQEIIESGETYFENRDQGRDSGYKQFKRWEYMALRLMNEDGFLPTTQQKLETLASYNSYLNETAQSRAALSDNWQELGPVDWTATSGWNPGVGRITGIAVDPTDSDIMIIGGHRGGVWRTTNGGQTWSPLNDNFVNLSVYSVTIDPIDPTIYYFGSSSGMIFRSTDSGATFSLLADISQSRIIKILIHPTNTDIIFASSENAGTFRSTDGGITWANVTNDGRSYDIEFMPGNPSVVYATGLSYHKSTDGGQTFNTINTTGFLGAPKMMGVSIDDPSVVYVLQSQSNAGGFDGLFKSEDGGETFTELNHAGRNYLNLDQNGVGTGGQAPRDMDIAINPNNVDEVHIGGGNTWRSLDGGLTFELNSFWFIPNVGALNVGYNHADIDFLMFEGSTLLTATDGGVFRANNPSGPINVNFWEDLTTGLGIREFYKIGIAQTIDQKITGGSQDNGTSIFQDVNGWTDWLGADGGEGFVDKDNNNLIYGTTQFGNVWRSFNNGINLGNSNNPPGQGNFVTPFEQDPVVQNRIYIGYDQIYRSDNGSVSWTSISQDISTNSGGFINRIDNLKVAPSNNQILYASVDRFNPNIGNFYRTTDGGATDWVQMTSPGGLINSIAVHPTNPDLVAVATTSNNSVLISNDGGATWQSCRKNLPNFAALAVVWDDNAQDGLYVGMNFGIYYIDNTLDEWEIFNNNLPNVIINELEINNETDMIYAASFGRGLWVSPVVDPTLSTDDFITEDSVTVFPNPATSEISIALDTPSEGDIRLFDITGKLIVFEKDIFLDTNHKIDLSSLESGTYFLRINTTLGTVTKKILRR